MAAELESVTRRFLEKDLSLWPTDSVASNRLGWLDVFNEIDLNELTNWANSVSYSRIILLGMGGSSLGPLVLGKALKSFGKSKRDLIVVDTTHPTTLREVDFEDALVIVSSKSGTTLEPNVLYAFARSKVINPKRFVAITDPDTALDRLAVSEGFERVFRNRADIGGRYSVLSHFGLVPAALVGYDLNEFLASARNLNYQEAVSLGIDLGNAVLAKKDKITLKVSETFRWVGLWLEQLLAESTGKNSTGCIPVPTTESEDSKDRFHVDVSIDSPLDLAGLFLKFEVATSIAGHILDIDPFNEPNVAESKANTNRVLEELPLPTLPTSSSSDLYPWLESSLKEGDYISIQAYLPFGQDDKLESLRRHIRDKFNSIAVTAGYGPRFLHSTGQLHKGGPNSVVCVQLVDNTPPKQQGIPGKNYDFATLIAAQSIGDYESLQAHSRRIIRIGVDDISDLIT